MLSQSADRSRHADPDRRVLGDASPPASRRPLEPASAPSAARRPNILILLADDMGFSDIGSFGSEIETPNIDRLAADGIRFTNFHVGAACSPTRTMLMTGVDNHLAGMGNMTEIQADNQFGKPGYEGRLNDKVVTVATLLRAAGYHTYMAGKWHLGKTAETIPYARGFERSFALMESGADNWQDMSYAPLYKEVHYYEDDKQVTLPKDNYYSTVFYTDKVIEYIDSNQADDQPWFAYLSFQAVHYPHQAPLEFIDKYDGVYDAGWKVAPREATGEAARTGHRIGRRRAAAAVRRHDLRGLANPGLGLALRRREALQRAPHADLRGHGRCHGREYRPAARPPGGDGAGRQYAGDLPLGQRRRSEPAPGAACFCPVVPAALPVHLRAGLRRQLRADGSEGFLLGLRRRLGRGRKHADELLQDIFFGGRPARALHRPPPRQGPGRPHHHQLRLREGHRADAARSGGRRAAGRQLRGSIHPPDHRHQHVARADGPGERGSPGVADDRL